MTELGLTKGNRSSADLLSGGLFVRGTLRMPREKVFDAVYANLQNCFGALTLLPMLLPMIP